MKTLKHFRNFMSIVKNRPSNVLLTTRNYSYGTMKNRNQGVTFFKSNDFVHKELSVFKTCLISRNLGLSNILCSKSKDRGKEKKKSKSTGKLDLREMSEFLEVDELTNEMNQAIEEMKNEFIKNLSLRSTTGSLEQMSIKVDDKTYELQELAQIARKPKLLVLNVASFPTAIPHILNAIEASGLNINPQQDGTTLFLPIPKVTKEHRENLAKNAKSIFIIHRDKIKDIRNKAIKNIKKKNISEDIVRRVSNQIEILCDKHLKEAEQVLQSKQNELLGSLE